MKPEGSLPCSQQSATGPYPEPDASNSQLSTLLPNTHCNTILPSKPRSSEWCFPFRSSDKKFVCISHSYHACYMPTHPIRLDLINLIILGGVYKLSSSSFCILLLPSFVTSSLSGPNFLPSTLFSNTLNLCFSLSVRDKASHRYKTQGKIILLYTLIFKS